ncbi:ficolin-2 [Nematostella vectensis]|uniref:ficolin-2 n=1 Tax=Nematostella vectensis TaxID=45351 RepID=UPI0020775C8F|nr:ficolin-2 [Nematostella vectensis]
MRFSSLILITLYNCLIVIASNQQDKMCKIMALTDVHNRKLLKNHTTFNITGIDEENCSVKCYLNDFCQSTIYNHTSKTCHISTSTRHQHPGDFVDDPETSYRGTENDCIPGSCSADRMCKADFTVGGFSCVCPVGSSTCVHTNCAEVLSGGGTTSGVYMVDPDGQGAFQVFCDQETFGGGWTVFQRRQDGSVDFWRDWAEYKNGFGDLQGEHWLGLDRIQRLTNAVATELRVDMEADAGETAHAQYGHFSIAAESDIYRLSVGGYSGTAGDSFAARHNNAVFSTKDRDNDSWNPSCAVRFKGAWWYTDCHDSNLNGYYYGGPCPYAEGLTWKAWKTHEYSLLRTEMKIRPKGFTP